MNLFCLLNAKHGEKSLIIIGKKQNKMEISCFFMRFKKGQPNIYVCMHQIGTMMNWLEKVTLSH